MPVAQGFGHRPKDPAPISVLSGRQVDRRVLAPPIDLEIELELVALIQLAHARTLDRADVHERVRLAIITRDEAKALHGVEELDRAGSLLTRQLTLRRGGLGRDRDHVTHDLQIGCGDLAAAIDEVELELLAFGKTFKACALDSADVDEHILTTVFALDEAKALLAVEELHHTLAGADDLSRHAAAAGTAEAATTAAATTAARTATEAAAITAAEAATVAAAEAAAITAAETTATATTAAAEAAAIKAAAAETTAAAVRVEAALVTETIALVASATPPPSVKTHKNQ
jgi:hypothetical protein